MGSLLKEYFGYRSESRDVKGCHNCCRDDMNFKGVTF